MNLQAPPEMADGGYWYVTPVMIDPVLGGKHPGDIPGEGWCAWYVGEFVAVRCPAVVTGVTTVPAPVEILSTPGRPYGRVGGR